MRGAAARGWADLRAADGRVPGRRGRQTRQRLLDATAAMLETTGYRDLRVVEIARRAGTSPATFYQYFAEVDVAILALAGEMADEGATLAESAGALAGDDPRAAAMAVVETFLAFWEEHQAVLRVVDLAIAEGDQRFREIRTHLLDPVTLALQEADIRGGEEAAAAAAVLVSMLAHVAEHLRGLEDWGVSRVAAAHQMADIIEWTVTHPSR